MARTKKIQDVVPNKLSTIYNDFANGLYSVIHLDKTKHLPNDVNVKNLVFYYVCYVLNQHNLNKNFKDLVYFVCVPQTELVIKNMDEFIEYIRICKYELDTKTITLKKT